VESMRGPSLIPLPLEAFPTRAPLSPSAEATCPDRDPIRLVDLVVAGSETLLRRTSPAITGNFICALRGGQVNS
jgi:hypothetical protein